MSAKQEAVRARWFVLGVFLLSSAINYLDRQTLATLGPLIRSEFHLTTEQFGSVISVFSIASTVPMNRGSSGFTKPVWAIAGLIEDRSLVAPHFTRLTSLVSNDTSLEEAMRDPITLLRHRTRQLFGDRR